MLFCLVVVAGETGEREDGVKRSPRVIRICADGRRAVAGGRGGGCPIPPRNAGPSRKVGAAGTGRALVLAGPQRAPPSAAPRLAILDWVFTSPHSLRPAPTACGIKISTPVTSSRNATRADARDFTSYSVPELNFRPSRLRTACSIASEQIYIVVCVLPRLTQTSTTRARPRHDEEEGRKRQAPVHVHGAAADAEARAALAAAPRDGGDGRRAAATGAADAAAPADAAAERSR